MASFIKGLELDKEELGGKLIVIKEEPGGDASFCLSCLMWNCLNKPDDGLLLLAAHHPFNHYYHVGMKIGYNLTSQTHRAIVLELGKHFVDKSADDFFKGIDSGDDESLRNLIIGLQEKLEHLKAERDHVYLFIDNISFLLFLGYTSRQLKLFTHYLRSLVSDKVTIVVLAQVSEDDVDENEVVQFAWQIANFRITVAPLHTGSSQDVSGTIELSKMDFSTVESWTKPKLYHYKLSDRNVKIFLPGDIL